MKRFELLPSRRARMLFTAAVVFVMLIFFKFFDSNFRIVFFLLAAPWVVYEWSLFKKYQPLLLAYDSKNIWYMKDQSGHLQKIDILPSSVVTAWCVLLDLRFGSNARRAVPIFSDQFIEKDHFRQLRVALRES